ncbi:MAG: hypothetical protein WCK88_02820 [bacterium]
MYGGALMSEDRAMPPAMACVHQSPVLEKPEGRFGGVNDSNVSLRRGISAEIVL